MALPERPLLAILAALSLLAAAGDALAQAKAAPQARKAPVQCWTDDRGQRVCGDVVPPSEARRQRALIDRRGVVTRVVPAQKTAAEVEAETRVRREQEQRAAYDRYLMQAYGDVPDIERTRDERLGNLDGQLRLAEKGRADTAKSLADLRARIGTPMEVEEGEAPKGNPRLDAKIAEFSRAEADHLKAIARLKQERIRISEEFARDIKRFRELKAVAPG
jgi:hypothetical protein